MSEKNETTFRVGVWAVHPIGNEVQECHTCSHKTALAGTKSRVDPVGDFFDYYIEFYDNYRIGNPKAIKDYLRTSETWLDRSWS